LLHFTPLGATDQGEELDIQGLGSMPTGCLRFAWLLVATIAVGYLVGGALSALYLWPHGGWYRVLPILLGVISAAIAPLLLWGVVVTLYSMAIGSDCWGSEASSSWLARLSVVP